MLVNALVEGQTDEIVARRLITDCGHEFGTCYGKRGASYILGRIKGFAAAAQYGPPLLILIDLMDSGLACARDLVPGLLRERPMFCLLRGVVRELESWLIADRQGIAAYLGVVPGRIPVSPEELPDPKGGLIDLARRCRKRTRRNAIVPALNASASTGPDYVGAIAEYVRDYWNPDRAAVAAPSLKRCLVRLREIRDEH